MKPLLCFLLSLCWIAPLSAQSATGLMTVEKYEKDYNQKITNQIGFLNNGKRPSINLQSWNTVTGETQTTNITPKDAETKLINLFNQGLWNDIANLPHWDKTKPLNSLTGNIPLVIVACDISYNQGKAQPNRTAVSSKLKASSKTQLLGVAFDGMAQKKRNCFSSRKYDLYTTLAHEMGHQYVIWLYPHLIQKKVGLAEVQKGRLESVQFVTQEAFAVYTEYKYLRKLADDKKITQFTIADFIMDAANKTNIYGVTPMYMRCFLQGLDCSKMIKDSNGKYTLNDIDFSYPFLKKSADICERLNKGKPVSDAEFQHKLILQNKIYGADGKVERPEKSIIIDYRDLVDYNKEEAWEYYKQSLNTVPIGNAAVGNHIHPWWTLNQTAHTLNLMELVTKRELDNLESFIDNSPISYFVGRYLTFDFLDKPSPEELEKRLGFYRKCIRQILLHEVLKQLNNNIPFTTPQTPQTGN